MYKICAMVRRICIHLLRLLMFRLSQVVQFVPGFHIPSPMYHSNEFELIGNIVTVWESLVVGPCLMPSLQLEYVHDDEDLDLQSAQPANLTTTGLVSLIDLNTDSFSVLIMQLLNGVSHLFPLVVCIMVYVACTHWFQSDTFPPVNSVIVFTVHLVAVENGAVIVADMMHPLF